MLKRKATVETDRKKKISLPAALFNRSPLKNTQNSSIISNTSLMTDPPCENHANKKGKYVVISEEIEEDEETFYCEKCAILLASKGFEVKKLESGPDIKTTERKKENPRERELGQFLSDVQGKIKVLQDYKRASAQQLSQLEENSEAKINAIYEFFDELYCTLEKHKNKHVHNISMRKKEAEVELAGHLTYLGEKLELLETMKEDIDSSHESIVKDTPEEDYQLVMSHYKKNLEEIKAEPLTSSMAETSLPSMESIQGLLAQLFESGGRSDNCFSFDSTKKPYE